MQEPSPSCTEHQGDMLPSHPPPHGRATGLPQCTPGRSNLALGIHLLNGLSGPTIAVPQGQVLEWLLATSKQNNVPLHPGLWQETFSFRDKDKRQGENQGHQGPPPSLDIILTCPSSGIGPPHCVGPSCDTQPEPVAGAGTEMLEGETGEAPPG